MARSLGRVSEITVSGSWIVFVASFFLPATNVLQAAGTPPGTPLSGWEAFTASILCGVMNPWAWMGDARVFLFLIFPFANALMLSAPVLFAVLRERCVLLALALVPSALVPWFLPKTLTGDLFIGFYCWNASFVLMSIGFAMALWDELCVDHGTDDN